MDRLSSHAIVSSESEELILVDASDRETGTLSKAACHDGNGILHRAFSLFVFNSNGELLLQQRSADKRLWPSFWSNSCCSHPRRGETMDEATGRRLDQELGVSAALEFVYKFTYQAQYDDSGAEHELCSVYLGRIEDDIRPNPNEIAATRFVRPAELAQELADDDGRFTPWFKLEWRRLNDEYGERLRTYCSE